MRVIGGIHRHRMLLGPKGKDTTRPITDRVKQSVFDRLTVMDAFDGAAIDVFSGTGSLGIEALSRGMDHVTFIERDRVARSLLEQNLDALKLTDRSRIMAVDVLSGAWVHLLPERPLTLIFMDPPYRMISDEAAIARLTAVMEELGRIADDEAVMLLRTNATDPAPTVPGWSKPNGIRYGSMVVHWYVVEREAVDPN